jgi:molybdopterin-guanine dinucleotide biosynthesis protein A
MNHDNLAAVILAGGKSLRMGRDKAFLEIDGRPLITIMLDLARPFTDLILISSNDTDAFAFLDFRVIPDMYAQQGPLAGLHSGMLSAARELVLLLPCDVPGLSSNLLRQLIIRSGEHDVVVPRTSDRRIHPLPGIYRRTCLPVLERELREGRNSMFRFLQHPTLKVCQLDGSSGAFEDSELENLNTPADVETFLGERNM